MSVEARTVRPRPTGSVRADWRDGMGNQHIAITVDPGRSDRDGEFNIELERRWGHMIGDVSTEHLRRMPRKGAEALRDALTAALEWAPEGES